MGVRPILYLLAHHICDRRASVRGDEVESKWVGMVRKLLFLKYFSVGPSSCDAADAGIRSRLGYSLTVGDHTLQHVLNE